MPDRGVSGVRGSLTERDDRELAETYLETRDEVAFRALYRRHAPGLWRMALRLSRGSEDEARELVQETWVRAARGLGSFRWESRLGTWLTSIAIHCDHERRRRAGRETLVEDVDAGGATAGTRPLASPGAPARVEPIDLARAIDALPDGYRTVLVLHDVEGYTHEEIGRLLGVEAGTSKSQLHRARARVRARLVATGGGAG